jgi:UDPglucose--hexose-1-phosphate uridylyltransferase
MPVYRQNPLTGAWVIIAPDRADRPGATAASGVSPDVTMHGTPGVPPDVRAAAHERTAPCPFCPGNERLTPPELFAYRFDRSPPDSPGWSVRVVPNKFPAATLDAAGVPSPESVALQSRAATQSAATVGADRLLCIESPAVGQHEVLVESPDHDACFALHPPAHAALVLDALRHRHRMLLHARDVRYLVSIENHGPASAATIAHPHFQTLAAAVGPPAAAAMLDAQETFAKKHGRALFDVMLEEEQADGRRIIAANDDFVAFAPWASQSPYEMWIVPRAPVPFFAELPDDALPPLAGLLQDVLRRLHERLDDPPYNLVIHSGPRTLRAADHARMFLQVLPRTSRCGGLELGAGLFINPVAPETAAAVLRDST